MQTQHYTSLHALELSTARTREMLYCRLRGWKQEGGSMFARTVQARARTQAKRYGICPLSMTRSQPIPISPSIAKHINTVFLVDFPFLYPPASHVGVSASAGSVLFKSRQLRSLTAAASIPPMPSTYIYSIIPKGTALSTQFFQIPF